MLDNADICYSCLKENDDINIVEVTTVPRLQFDMRQKLFVLTTGSVKEAEQAILNRNGLINVIIDTGCLKYLSRLHALNLILIGKNDIGKAFSILYEALRH